LAAKAVGFGARALLLTSTVLALLVAAPGYGVPAVAQEDGDGGQGGQNGQGNQGGSGAGQGGPSEDSEGKGPQAGSASGSGGGKPAWAQEGIPEVELGRLNVARSPDKVLEQALAEAVANVNDDVVSFYNLSLDEAIATLSLEFDTVTIYDSPLQSLALLQDSLDGTSVLAESGVTNDVDTLMALFIGIASDKTIGISTDTVVALTTILGDSMSEDEAAALAIDAEAVRVAVLAGHG
jgi:hypothetical protein